MRSPSSYQASALSGSASTTLSASRINSTALTRPLASPTQRFTYSRSRGGSLSRFALRTARDRSIRSVRGPLKSIRAASLRPIAANAKVLSRSSALEKASIASGYAVCR